MTQPDYLSMMDTQQAVDLAIVDAFAAMRVDFAYPTQTLFVEKTGSF
jgi:hypothetical protein